MTVGNTKGIIKYSYSTNLHIHLDFVHYINRTPFLFFTRHSCLHKIVRKTISYKPAAKAKTKPPTTLIKPAELKLAADPAGAEVLADAAARVLDAARDKLERAEVIEAETPALLVELVPTNAVVVAFPEMVLVRVTGEVMVATELVTSAEDAVEVMDAGAERLVAETRSAGRERVTSAAAQRR